MGTIETRRAIGIVAICSTVDLRCRDGIPPETAETRRLVSFLHRHRRSITIATVLTLLAYARPAAAAGPSKLEYSVAAVSPLAQKRLESVQDFLAARQWSEAFAVMDEVQREHRRALVEAEPGRWISVPRRISEITAALPREGLDAYRARVDSLADSWRREAEQGDDPARWQRLVDDVFASSAGDEALWRLGGIRWQQGDPAAARELWSSLLPPDVRAGKGTGKGAPPTSLRHPDPGYAEEVVLARLLLCDLLLGERPAAEARLVRLRDRFPESRGTIGGREGRYADLLAALLGKDPNEETQSPPWLGLAGPEPRRIGAPLWSLPLAEDHSAGRFGVRPVTQVPALWKDLCIVAGNHRVLALRADSGKPAWPSGAKQDDGSIFEGDAEPRGAVRWPRPLHRPAIDTEGRCFVRVGVGAQPNQLSLLKNDVSRIVALDLGRGEGRLLWSTLAGELSTAGPAAPAWGFASSPVVASDRVLAVVRSPGTESQCGVACLSAATGDLLWLQPVATVISEADPLWGRESLQHGSGRVLLNLDGLVAALRLEDGRFEWCVRRVAEEAGFSRRSEAASEISTIQPLVAGGRVYALWSGEKPGAGTGHEGEVRGLDLADGSTHWQTTCSGRAESAITLRNGVLAVAGESLWGLDSATGARRWRVGYDDPASRGAGPGWSAGNDLFWCTSEDLFTVDLATGTLLHRVPLADEELRGGSLLAGARELFVVGANRLQAFQFLRNDSGGPSRSSERP